MSKMTYVSALTGLRALAAGLVFLHHYFRHWHPSPGPIADFFESGELGVSVFFCLSGFLITQTYFDRLGRGEISLGQYWLKRAARILPVYWVLLAICLMGKPGAVSSTKQLLANVFLGQSLFASTIWTGIMPAWSLTLEECFYALVVALFALIRLRKRPSGEAGRKRETRRAAWVVGGTAVVLWGIGSQLASRSGATDFLARPEYIFDFNLFGRFPDFGLGILLALFMREKKRKISPIASDGFFLAGAVLLFVALAQYTHFAKVIFPTRPTEPLERCWMFWLTAASTAVLIYGMVAGSRLGGWILGNRVVEYLGRISFCLYLLQDSYFMNLIFQFMGRLGTGPSNLWLLYALLTVMAAFFYHAVEKPAHAWISRRR